MALAIKVENLSKAYQIGEIGTGTLAWDIERWFAKLRGKEDRFLKIVETNGQTTNESNKVVWSLREINFEIKQGDALGIIGRNGAGKSTLLKVLSRVTSPTYGKMKVKGRIASLLEVGTGFHPELTGRENLFLNGAILGMRKKEILKKFDEIVDFAGVERYIDTPVKRYSSGMYVRLAFAVAAHLESEILIVDEVLAVGDIEFQKKCLGKMGEISQGEGRTVLFVSHNMEAVESLTRKAIFLKNGILHSIGCTKQIVEDYLTDFQNIKNIKEFPNRSGNGKARVIKAELYSNCKKVSSIKQGDKFDILIGVQCQDTLLMDIGIVIGNHKEQALFCSHLSDTQSTIKKKGYFETTVHVNTPYLRFGNYMISIVLFRPDRSEFYDEVRHFPIINIEGQDEGNLFPIDVRLGDFYFKTNWSITQ